MYNFVLFVGMKIMKIKKILLLIFLFVHSAKLNIHIKSTIVLIADIVQDVQPVTVRIFEKSLLQKKW